MSLRYVPSRRRFDRFLSDRDALKSGVVHASVPDSGRRRRAARLRDYADWLTPFRGAIAGIFTLAVLSIVLHLLQPMASRYVIDNVLLNPRLTPAVKVDKLTLLGLVVTVVLLSTMVLDWVRAQWLSAVNLKLVMRVRRKLFHRVLRLPLQDIQRMKIGGVTTVLGSDTAAVSDLLERGLLIPITEAIRVAITIGMMLWINWRMALLGMIALPVMVAISVAIIHRLRPVYAHIHGENARSTAWLTEVIGGIKVIRMFARERMQELQYALGYHAVARATHHAALRQKSVDSAWGLLISLSLFLLICVGGILVTKGVGTIGEMAAITMYMSLAFAPVFRIVNSESMFQKSLAAYDRVQQVLQMPVERHDAIAGNSMPRKVESLRFVDVTFGYQREKPVLSNLNLTLPSGCSLAVIGPSGAGKTTLTSLLTRLYDPLAGRILLNGEDIRQFAAEEYRGLFATVEQDVFLFDGTIAENIAIGARHPSAEAIRTAAHCANAHGFITELPDGYDTMIGERGVSLSGGQRQRLSIARAFLANAQILILDEATSSLDSESERSIQSALTELMRERTTIIVAHRLSTIQNANLVLVLDRGRVLEHGSPSDLLQRRGYYWRVLQAQTMFAGAAHLETSTVVDFDGPGLMARSAVGG